MAYAGCECCSKNSPAKNTDQHGITHHYSINNTVTPLLARWLLENNPDLRIETRKSMFDRKDEKK